MIQGQDKENIVCDCGGPSKDNGKYTGWIQLHKNGIYHADLLNTNAIYETREDAVTAMQSIVDEVRSMELDE